MSDLISRDAVLKIVTRDRVYNGSSFRVVSTQELIDAIRAIPPAEAAARIEKLLEQRDEARRDAVEAEAYVGELETKLAKTRTFIYELWDSQGHDASELRDLIDRLDSSPQPNDKLRQMYADYRKAISDGRLKVAPTDAATQKGGDAHDRRLRSHEASPGVTAGADAAQAREAALREAHKAILAMDTKKDEDLTYNLAVLRAAEKVRRLIEEART